MGESRDDRGDEVGPLGPLAGRHYHQVEGGALMCDVCPRACVMRPGDRGFCFVRQNQEGRMALTTYGRSTGFCIDPVEKKPLNHFLPGTSVLSFGTAGCNLGCQFCQNWSISKSREIQDLSEAAMPDEIAAVASGLNVRSVAFTYNDPVVWLEYAHDTARACREAGIKTIAVTAGYITEQARPDFYRYIDAANVDLKAFSEIFYQRLTLSHLTPVLETLKWLRHESDVWLEITNLVIPQENDSQDEISRMCQWIATNLGDSVPVHFTAFHPDFRLDKRPPTPPATLVRAREIAGQFGLKYVYTGNVDDPANQSTYCPACHMLLIQRNWYEIGRYEIVEGACRYCREKVPGVFEAAKGDWGRKRVPVSPALLLGQKRL